MKKKTIISVLMAAMIALSACNADVATNETTTTTSEITTSEELTTTVTELTTTTASEIRTEELTEATSEEISEETTTGTSVAETTTATEETTTANTTEEIATTTTTVTTTTTEVLTTTVAETIKETQMEAIEKKYIALTFDDGPNTTTTNEVLDVLEQYGIKGSFFLIGNNINSESEKSVKRAYDMGCDIGNHSKSHPYMNELSVEEIEAEIDYVTDKIVEITGEEPKFFRPPYIAINNTMYNTIDLTFIAGFGCNDWDDKVTAERRAKVIIRQAQDGGIILLHDAQGNSKTVEALHTIIPELQAQGFEFVTLTELFEIKGVKLSADDNSLYSFVGQ